MKNLLLFVFICLLCVSILFSGKVSAQDSLKTDNDKYYRVSWGAGIGSGFPLQENDMGFGGALEFAVQQKNSAYAVGGRIVSEFVLFDNSNVTNSIWSVDLTYGRAWKTKFFYGSISTGVGLVTTEEEGKLLDYSGGWFFGQYTYERVIHHTVGLPISGKFVWVPTRFYGVGIELFANINSRSTFYGVNTFHQIGKLRPRIYPVANKKII